AAEVPVHVVRYEDMSRTPQQTFAASIAFAGLPAGEVRLARALEFSRFDELRRQEREAGFRERSPHSAGFFRQGRIGGWRAGLTTADVERMIESHGATMQRFGYLAASGEPAF
ncbi:MAG: sulfotransferase domain-containing protein, partial [Longimicrobiales bacterium]